MSAKAKQRRSSHNKTKPARVKRRSGIAEIENKEKRQKKHQKRLEYFKKRAIEKKEFMKTIFSKKELKKVMENMELPIKRVDKMDLTWLLRNVKIKNSKHSELDKVIKTLKYLKEKEIRKAGKE